VASITAGGTDVELELAKGGFEEMRLLSTCLACEAWSISEQLQKFSSHLKDQSLRKNADRFAEQLADDSSCFVFIRNYFADELTRWISIPFFCDYFGQVPIWGLKPARKT